MGADLDDIAEAGVVAFKTTRKDIHNFALHMLDMLKNLSLACEDSVGHVRRLPVGAAVISIVSTKNDHESQ